MIIACLLCSAIPLGLIGVQFTTAWGVLGLSVQIVGLIGLVVCIKLDY